MFRVSEIKKASILRRKKERKGSDNALLHSTYVSAIWKTLSILNLFNNIVFRLMIAIEM